MKPAFSRLRGGALVLAIGAAGVLLTGCGTFEQNIALGAAGVTAFGARTPANEIRQIYYFGVFDPQEQVQPMVYRVRVVGQASMISGMKFGSGWVHASVIDALGTTISFNDKSNKVEITKTGSLGPAGIKTGRKLVLFGPEGFRMAPKDHRLVIVMGASPEKFFAAIDESLQAVSKAIAEQRHQGLNKALLDVLTKAKSERDKIDRLAKDIDTALSGEEGDAR